LKQCLIVGRPKVGKTLFLINYAEFLGQKSLRIVMERPDFSVSSLVLSPEEARIRLVSDSANTTRTVQAIMVPFRAGKARVEVEFCDTPGLTEGISSDQEVRRAMAQAIRKIKSADLVIHMLDAQRVLTRSPAADTGDIDREIARFGLGRGGYLMLINKMDLPGLAAAPERARQAFPGHLVIGVSALRKHGFREVTRVVRRYL
jgi:GTPase Era involved in 16S rRNA processing